ncbi:MAG: four helix bundle protein [Candidatus Dojkabacteria bacterium]|nr:four helix bundle protein [Candidatus Dojkabacteria bacterium]
MNLVVDIYEISKSFPKDELFALTSQIRRSSVSIPSNIAEGSKRGTRKDYRNFIRIANGSTAELLTQLEIDYKLKYIDQDQPLRNI